MSYARQLLDTYPASASADADVLATAIDALSDCAQACTADVDADLIAVGTHEEHPDRLPALGTTAERLVRCSPVPVLLCSASPTGASSLYGAREWA